MKSSVLCIHTACTHNPIEIPIVCSLNLFTYTDNMVWFSHCVSVCINVLNSNYTLSRANSTTCSIPSIFCVQLTGLFGTNIVTIIGFRYLHERKTHIHARPISYKQRHTHSHKYTNSNTHTHRRIYGSEHWPPQFLSQKKKPQTQPVTPKLNQLLQSSKDWVGSTRNHRNSEWWHCLKQCVFVWVWTNVNIMGCLYNVYGMCEEKILSNGIDCEVGPNVSAFVCVCDCTVHDWVVRYFCRCLAILPRVLSNLPAALHLKLFVPMSAYWNGSRMRSYVFDRLISFILFGFLSRLLYKFNSQHIWWKRFETRLETERIKMMKKPSNSN